MRRPINILLFTILTLIPATVYMSCGGGGNNQSTAINGRIENLVTASSGEERDFKFVRIKELFTLMKEAKAQGGINVAAVVEGVTKDSDVTEGDGGFTPILDLDSATNVSIVFEVNESEVSIDIFAEQGSITDISINIELGAEPGGVR